MSFTLAAILGTQPRIYRLMADGTVRPADNRSGGLDVADLQATFTNVVIDSRKASDGSLFVALPGERTDGHAHLGEVLTRGARGALVAQIPPDLPGARGTQRYLFLVDSPLVALQELARIQRDAHDTRVVGITGSIGKTTTKEILAQILSSRGPVLKSAANLNTEIGMPLTLMDLGPEHWAAVLEMGMYGPGDIALLTSIARPDVGIVTNVAPIHLERTGSIERIARAKSELVSGLQANGLAVLNGDNIWTRSMAISSGIAQVVLVGYADDCDYRAVDVKPAGLDGLSFRVQAERRVISFTTSIPGTHIVYALLSAIAVGRHFGMAWSHLQEAVAGATLDERQRIIRGERALIIDDSYNAAPMSVCAALDLLREASGTKIAVLGDMLELGPQEEEAHRSVGRRTAEVADWLVVRGERSRWVAEEAGRSGMPADRIRLAAGNTEAARLVREIMGTETEGGPVAILVKGSRGMRMEDVVKELSAGVDR